MEAQTLDGWLEALASAHPTPGGGAASAVLIAAGAALVEMACTLTVGREKFRAVEPLMQETAARARALRIEASGLSAEDAAAFDAVSAAYALPRGTSEEKAARSARIQEALHGATEVPLRTARAGVAVLDLAAAIAGKANPNVVSDVGAGALSARAGAEAAALNVEINLASLKDAAYVAQQRAAINELRARAAIAAQHALDAVRAAIGG